MRKELIDLANNKNKVSLNLLSNHHIQEITIDGKQILQVYIPRATRQQKPIFLNGNPFGGNAYQRLHEADQKLSDDSVKRMLAEQVEDSRDNRILSGYNLNDIHIATLRTYRQVFANRTPDNPWNHEPDLEFLMRIGAWRKNRETGSSRGAVYHISGFETPNPEDVFGTPTAFQRFETNTSYATSSPNNIESSPNNRTSSPNSAESSPNNDSKRDNDGCIISIHIDRPVVDDIGEISVGLKNSLFNIASAAREKKRISPEVIKKIILDLCNDRYITLAALSDILNRKPDTLREHYLSKLVKSKVLIMAFPKTPNDPRQAYRTA